MKRYLLLFPVAAFMLLTGCAHVISEANLRLADPTISFARLRENPDAYVGKYILLGGIIAGTKNTKEGGQLEVVQMKLDESGMPESYYNSGGRFLATSQEFLDNIIFKIGRQITLVGEVTGKKVQTLDEVQYVYPVIAIKEIHIWKSSDYDNQYPYPPAWPYYRYDPYYYGYDSPFWYRPYGPVFRRW